MSNYIFKDKNQKPGKDTLMTSLGDYLGGMCADLLTQTADESGGMQNIRASWHYDNVNGAWYLIVGNTHRDLYSIYGESGSFVCHFLFKNAGKAEGRGYSAWLRVADEQAYQTAVDTIGHLVIE